MRGLFDPLPIRLGGTDEEGWPARMHARACADLVALKRVCPLAVFTYTKSGATVTVHDYTGMNGAGSAYQPDDIGVTGTGHLTFSWADRKFDDPYEITHPLNAKHGRVTGHGSASLRGVVVVVPNGITVRTFNGAGAAADGKATVVLW